MNSHFDRRDLLRIGLGGMAGLSLPAGVLASQEGAGTRAADISGSVRRLSASYIIQPGVISRLEGPREITLSAPWGIPAAFSDVSRDLQMPVAPKLEDLMKWVEGSESERAALPFHADLSLDEAIRVPVLGGLPMTNLIGDTLDALLAGEQIKLELAFSTAPNEATTRRIDLSNGLPVVLPGATPAPSSVSEAEGQPELGERATVRVPLGSWQLVLTGPETHSLGSCVKTPVKHFNLHIQRAVPNRPGRYQDVKNFHLGSYKSGSQRCFVLWNSVSPGVVCWKKCSPRSSDLKEILAWTILVAAAIVGVKLAASVAAAMAATAAVIFFPVLITL